MLVVPLVTLDLTKVQHGNPLFQHVNGTSFQSIKLPNNQAPELMS